MTQHPYDVKLDEKLKYYYNIKQIKYTPIQAKI